MSSSDIPNFDNDINEKNLEINNFNNDINKENISNNKVKLYKLLIYNFQFLFFLKYNKYNL